MKVGTVVVVGASGAIGKEIAKNLGRKHERVILLGRNTGKLEDLKNSIQAENFEIHEMHNIDNIAKQIASIFSKETGIIGLVCAAGQISINSLARTTLQAWREIFDANLFLNSEIIRGAAEGLRGKERPTSLVFISSVSAARGEIGLAPYSASKASLEALVRSAAVELAGSQIRVNSIALGLLDSGMSIEINRKIGSHNYQQIAKSYPLGLGNSSSILGAVDFLLSNNSEWITGTNLVVDGGFLAR